jgi:hypothetical protein
VPLPPSYKWQQNENYFENNFYWNVYAAH